MPTKYRNNAGVDFEDLFEPGTTAIAGYNLENGSPMRFAARGSTTKRADVNYRTAAGSDVTNTWMAKGAAPPALGFDGQSYGAVAQALTGQTGTTRATLRLQFYPGGRWEIERTLQNSASAGSIILDSGTWLPSGDSADQYTLRFQATTSGSPTVNNSAASAQPATSPQSFSASSAVASTSPGHVNGLAGITVTLAKGGSSSQSTLSFSVQARGWA